MSKKWNMSIRRQKAVVGVIALLAILVSPVGVLIVYLLTSGGIGSPEEAIRLKAIIEQYDGPETSGTGRDDYAAKRFSNNEWVLGLGRDSHEIMSKYNGGGTLVVKDSRGHIRCFFGHVCGPGDHQSFMARANSLDEFYQLLVKYDRFKEYIIP